VPACRIEFVPANYTQEEVKSKQAGGKSANKTKNRKESPGENWRFPDSRIKKCSIKIWSKIKGTQNRNSLIFPGYLFEQKKFNLQNNQVFF